MTCPKCKKEIPYDSNLCCYCANPIREKCPECGKMELIGRKVCETKIKKIHKEEKKYLDVHLKKRLEATTGSWIMMLSCFVTIVVEIGFVYSLVIDQARLEYFQNSSWSIVIIILCIALFFGSSGAYFENKLLDTLLKKELLVKKEFFRLHPEYAEIIKKAVGKVEKK